MSTSKKSRPVALTVAGSDSGGNAGVMADLRVFRDFRVHGTVALTALTAQNPHCVRAVHAVPPAFILEQLSAVLEDYDVRAAKTGMLFNTSAIRAAAAVFGETAFPLVVDPVMVATSGARLLQPAAVRALEDTLLPLAFLATPNVPEAEILSGVKITGLESAALAAETMARRFGCAILVKGGHILSGSEPSVVGKRVGGKGSRARVRFSTDVMFADGGIHFISAPRVAKPVSTHGTGCMLSAAIAAGLANGSTLRDAVQSAKDYVTAAIAGSYLVGPHAGVLA